MDLSELINMSGLGAAPGDPALLDRNLRVLAARSPGEAELIRQGAVRTDLVYVESEEGLSAMLGGTALASKRRPISEAKKLAMSIDPEQVAVAGVLGFGLGYHCSELLERMGPTSVLVCFEPDVGLLRSVLSHIDCTKLFATGRFFLVCDAQDRVRMSSMLTGNEALVALGVRLINHPPSTARLGAAGDEFSKTFTGVLRAARTHVITTLANSRVSFRNGIMNLDHYLRTAGITGLKGSCEGKAAIVVSAGPSLQKNIELLCEAGVRDRFVIVAVQTVLKPLLARGIKPHFVAALDYHEVSGRFYEGLTAADVQGVRLIAEARANPVILDAFPGEVLCPSDSLLDQMLGEGSDRGEVPNGATVAHLCYSFARYLGCDPVVLIGQDLGFSDGQYYAAGAAIHHVWGSELSAHRTLEMFEWERVARMRAHLQRRGDIHGKPIYSDEQMCSYLTQFESMFAKDRELGRRTIDASEGGVLKRCTELMPLRDAIEQFGRDDASAGLSGCSGRSATEMKTAEERVGKIIEDCQRIALLSERSLGTLDQMLRTQRDQRQVTRLIGKVNADRDEVMAMRDAFTLVEYVNQIAVLNRMKRDRVIALRSRDAEPIERQRLQIERDIENVKWTRDAALSVVEQLKHGLAVLAGEAIKQTSNQPEPEELNSDGSTRERDRVHAMVLTDPELGGLGNRRTLAARLLGPGAGGLNVLQTTIARIDRSQEIEAITIMTPDAQGVSELLGSMQTRHPIDIVEVDAAVLRSHTMRVGAARAQSHASWRGSLGMLCVYDELAQPTQLARVMQTRGIDAVALVGGDWAMVDAGLIDQTVARLRQQRSEKRIAFSQACVGLGTMVLDRNAVQSLADATKDSGRRNHMATFGALMSYLPTAPQSDPIVRGVCVQVDPTLRDAGLRAVADTGERFDAMKRAYEMASDPMQLDAMRCVEMLQQTTRISSPRVLVLETCTGRLLGGDWGRWKRGSLEAIERMPIALTQAHAMLRELCSLREDASIVFDGVGDPLMHPEALDLIALAKEDGAACVELRTDLMREGIDPRALLESGVDLLSVDLVADHPRVYQDLTAVDGYERVCDRLQGLYDLLGSDEHGVWLAARMTRCERTLDQVESFYDKWLMLTGCAIIDGLPGFVQNQRVAQLPIPAWRAKQLERETMRVRCDGVVVDRDGHPVMAQGSTINAIHEGVEKAYQRLRGSVRAEELEIKLGVREPAA